MGNKTSKASKDEKGKKGSKDMTQSQKITNKEKEAVKVDEGALKKDKEQRNGNGGKVSSSTSSSSLSSSKDVKSKSGKQKVKEKENEKEKVKERERTETTDEQLPEMMNTAEWPSEMKVAVLDDDDGEDGWLVTKDGRRTDSVAFEGTMSNTDNNTLKWITPDMAKNIDEKEADAWLSTQNDGFAEEGDEVDDFGTTLLLDDGQLTAIQHRLTSTVTQELSTTIEKDSRVRAKSIAPKPKPMKTEAAPVNGGKLKKALRKQMDLIATSDEEWDVRVKAMETIEDILREGEIQDVKGFWKEMSVLKKRISTQLDDLRSSIIKQACLLLVAVADCVGDEEKFSSFFKHCLPHLFSKLYVTIKVIRESADECTKAVIRRSKALVDCIPTIADAAVNDSHPQVRHHCVEYLTRIIIKTSDDGEEKANSDEGMVLCG